jgi:hypothetical protein
MWKARLDSLSRPPGERRATHYTAQMYLLPAYVADLIRLSKHASIHAIPLQFKPDFHAQSQLTVITQFLDRYDTALPHRIPYG